jgi:hypothetical protein
MTVNVRHLSLVVVLCIVGATALAGDAPNPFIGRWALTIPGGGAGWLGVTQEDGYLDASVLWGGGSVVPVDWVSVVNDELYVLRLRKVERRNRAGEVVRTQMLPESLVAAVNGDSLELVQRLPDRNGIGLERRPFTGRRIPPLPDKPDLSKAKYGKPVKLFNGTDLSGWKLTNPRAKSAWSAENGILVNSPAPRGSGPRVHYGNLRTVEQFEDFRLTRGTAAALLQRLVEAPEHLVRLLDRLVVQVA